MIFKRSLAARPTAHRPLGRAAFVVSVAAALFSTLAVQPASATDGATSVWGPTGAQDSSTFKVSTSSVLCPEGMSVQSAGYMTGGFQGSATESYQFILASFPIVQDGRVGWQVSAAYSTVTANIVCVPEAKPGEQTIVVGPTAKWTGSNRPMSVAYCPAGSTVATGGYRLDNLTTNGSRITAHVLANGPTQSASGWYTETYGSDATTAALCTKN
ncbi:hypothetical protein [Streptomyces sp. NPDC058874]|uniref:hypothetical protein n=1 Tax=unclassified Streptomyces TaxID=2593676 RepID=UPI0036CA741E